MSVGNLILSQQIYQLQGGIKYTADIIIMSSDLGGL